MASPTAAFQFAVPVPRSQTVSTRRIRFSPVCTQQRAEQVNESAATAAAATLILKKAAKAYLYGGVRPRPIVVRSSILELEKVQRLNKMKSDVQKLDGQWRLVFFTDKKVTNPFTSCLYFPLRAHQTFKIDGEEGTFDNGIFILRSLFFRLTGPLRWVTQRNMLQFSVDRVTVRVGPFEWVKDGLDKEGYSLEGRTAKTLPFFTFFCIRDDLAVARGRTGGLALYTRVPEDQIL